MNTEVTKPKVLAIVGPTASGKSGLAIALAKRFAGEIISADSRQVYRGLDVGTAKVTPAEMGDIPHHCLDIVDVSTIYTAADFKRDGTKAIEYIIENNHLPIIAGGTFFYVDTLLDKISHPAVPPNQALRAELEDLSTDTLFARLQKLDPVRAKTIDAQNRRRLIRALEIADALGEVPEPEVKETPYDTLTIGLTVEKEVLLKKLKARAEEWLSGPFETEVRALLENGVKRERLTEIGFEYLLMLAYIDGLLSADAFIQKCVEKNWQYAKRQLTWLKRDNTIKWFEPHDPKIFELVQSFLSSQ